jgi:hypothetical protein
MIILLTTSLMVTSWHDCWFQVARSVQSGDHFLQADLNEAARAADASREANGAVYGERLK